MKNTNYKQIIQQANTLAELENIKNDFISECQKRESKIKVSEMLHKIDNFGLAKNVFESITTSLLSKKGGKGLINKYVSIIKENNSLKTLYAYHEGLNENETSISKKSYITEALSIATPIDNKEYIKGVGQIINLISESFKLLGDDFVLNNIKIDENAKMLGDSLVYLSTTKKTIKNINEYISHINKVTDTIVENNVKTINVDSTLEEIVSEMNKKNDNVNINEIFSVEDKESVFKNTKNICIEMISYQKKQNSDNEIVGKLNEMEEKLSKKEYNYDTFTKDMLYMTELQEVLK